MKHTTWPLVVCTILALYPGAARAGDGPKLAVMSIVAEKGIDKATQRILSELLLTRLTEPGIFGSVIGEQDIVAMIQIEEERAKLTGCVDETCLAEIGGALGVTYVFAASIGQMGEAMVFSAKLLNARRATVAGRGSLIVPPDEEALVEAVSQLVDDILEQAFPQAGAIGAAAWSMAAVGAACLVAGAVTGGLTLVAQDEFDDLERYDPDRDTKGDELRNMGLATDVLLGVGAAAAVTSLILFLVGDDVEDAGPVAAVSPLLGPDRAGLALGVRF